MKKLLLALVIATSAHAADQLSLKGIRAGMPLEEAKTTAPWLFEFCRPREKSTELWSCFRPSGAETLANRPVKGWMVTHDGTRVTSLYVQMETREFDHVVAALTERWGKPVVEESSVTNRMGAAFKQTEAKWIQGKDQIWARRRASKVDEMSVMISSDDAVKQHSEERKKGAKDAAKDL